MSNPKPWRFDWEGANPRILDANGVTVANLSTGTIESAYSFEEVENNAKALLKGNE